MRLIFGKNMMLSKAEQSCINEAINYFMKNRNLFDSFAQSLVFHFENSPMLGEFIHFIKYRIKDEGSLRAKLEKIVTSVGGQNLVDKITDFAGVRVIHLHIDQLTSIHPAVVNILNEQKFELLKTPTAYYWDLEYKDLFQQIGIEAKQRESMYMTVHYDIVANQRKRITCEVQVRSLMEELWGEVSHRINYPNPSPNVFCQDQLKVLARLTSGCGRLVDTIFKMHHETVE